MKTDNLQICQSLLDQTRSIDHTAELMNEHINDVRHGIKYWIKQICRHINKGDLVI